MLRRKAEELILAGKVKVNGKVVDTLGTKVSGNDEIVVNGKEIAKESKVYYVMYKPKGTICSVKDDKDRKTVLDYAPKGERIYPIGRLDYDTSGTLLLSNDGNFTNMMIHPRYHIPKTYLVNLQGMLSQDDLNRLKHGLKTKTKPTSPQRFAFVKRLYARSDDL